MLNIFAYFKDEFCLAIKSVANLRQIEVSDENLKKFTVEPAKDKSHGDLACNAAMVLNKIFLLSPKQLSELLIEELKNHRHIAKIEVAGPGFINLTLQPQIFFELILQLSYTKKISFPNYGNGIKVNLEYASPNPTGPIHVGHTRGSIYGDVLANLLEKCGFEVLREYYINDAGSQINTLLKSVLWRYREVLGEKILITEGLYPGQYLVAIAEEVKRQFGNGLFNLAEEEILPKIRDFVVGKMLEMIKFDLLALGIKHDSYFSEKIQLHDTQKIQEAVAILSNKGLIYKGKLEVPKTEKGVGALPEDYEEKEQILFRSTFFGDDQDRVVFKADGNPTYFAADIAYVKSKFDRGARIFIMPLGFDHAGYVKRLKAVVTAITNNQAELQVILCQMVKFVKNGEPLKMSKRAGNFITAAQVVEEVGADVLRFIMLTRKNDAPFDFDLAKVIEQSKDNPVFYVQYAHARCCSVLRNLESEMPDLACKINESNCCEFSFEESKLDKLHEAEINLMVKIANFPRIVEMAVNSYEPHRIAFYLQELSAEFHSFWNLGSGNKSLKFIVSGNENQTKFRICMVLAVKKVISAGLEIFNISPANSM